MIDLAAHSPFGRAWHWPHGLHHAHHPMVEALAVTFMLTVVAPACTPPTIPLQPATGYSMDYSAAAVTRTWRPAAANPSPAAATPGDAAPGLSQAPVLRQYADGMIAIAGVPWFHQGNDRTCAQANIATLLNFWGVPLSYPAVVQEMNPGNLPTDVGRVTAYLRRKGLTAQDYRLSTVNFLRAQVNAGHPTLVLLDFGSLASTHYVTVKGYDASGHYLLINDPIAGPNVVMDVDAFSRLWRNKSLASLPGVGDRYTGISFVVQATAAATANGNAP